MIKIGLPIILSAYEAYISRGYYLKPILMYYLKINAN